MTAAPTDRIWILPQKFWAATKSVPQEQVDTLMEELMRLAESRNLEALRRYMFDNMYLRPTVRAEFVKAQHILTALFEHVVAHPVEFFGEREEPVERLAIDFLAGMTDRYAINLYEKLFVPRAWV